MAAGDVLGRLVVADSHCFPAACLHWGLIEGSGDDQTYLDPLSLVGGGPVRLLPLWRDEPATVRLPWAPPLEAWRRPWTGWSEDPRQRPRFVRWRVSAQARGWACW